MIHTLESWDTHWTHTSKAWDTVGYNNYKFWDTLYLQDWYPPLPPTVYGRSNTSLAPPPLPLYHRMPQRGCAEGGERGVGWSRPPTSGCLLLPRATPLPLSSSTPTPHPPISGLHFRPPLHAPMQGRGGGDSNQCLPVCNAKLWNSNMPNTLLRSISTTVTHPFVHCIWFLSTVTII